MSTIIITGANGGLGTAVTEKFLSAGYRVIGASHSERKSEYAGSHPMYEHHVVNVAAEAEAQKFIDEVISRHKTVSGALLLVGGFQPGKIEKTTGADLKHMFAQNFESAFYIVKPILKHMMTEKYGRIVLIGAAAALESDKGYSSLAYSLSKSLLVKLSELINAGAKGTDVVCSVVAPSTIDTPANRQAMPGQDTSKWVSAQQLADILEFICSDKSAPLRQPLYKVYGGV